MMYSEYIRQGGKGIIQLLNENQTLSYLPSEFITPLDTAFNFENGSKNFSLSVNNLLNVSNDLTTVASMLKARFNQEWELIYKTMPSDQEKFYGKVTDAKGQTTVKGTNQVAGYDSETMVDDSSNQQAGSNDATVNELDYTELTKLLGELKNNNYYDTIFSNIRTYIFNTVYGNERTE